MHNPQPMTPAARDLTRTTLGVLFIGALIVATLWILRPFIGPTIWATMIVVTTWPVMRWVQARLWGRRGLAVLVMSLAILMLLVVPLMLAIGTIVRHADDIIAQAAMLSGWKIPPPPAWVAAVADGRRLARATVAAGGRCRLGRPDLQAQCPMPTTSPSGSCRRPAAWAWCSCSSC